MAAIFGRFSRSSEGILVEAQKIATRLSEWLFSISMLAQQPPINQEISEAKNERERMEIDRFVYNVTEAAAKGELDPVIGRDQELENMIHILLRRRKNNPLLL